MIGASDMQVGRALPKRSYPFDVYRDGLFQPKNGPTAAPSGFRCFAMTMWLGDHGQLPPVLDTAWFKEPGSSMAHVGKRVVDAIAFSVNLVGSVRQQNDTTFGDLLWRLHEGDGSRAAEDWRALNARAIQSLPASEKEVFQQIDPQAVRLFAEKEKARAANLFEVKAGFRAGRYEAISNIPAAHFPAKAKAGTSEQAMGLQASLWVGINFPMMVISNLWTKVGVTNGLRGTLWDLLCVKDPWVDVPPVALLKVRRCDVRGLPEYLPRITSGWSTHTLVPVPVVERKWMVGGIEHCRKQLPLRAAFAITVHKSQGMTIPKIILDPGDLERHVGILVTGLSRSPDLDSVALARPMDMQRLNMVFKSRSIVARKAWEQQRWRQPTLAVENVMRHALVGAGGNPQMVQDVCAASYELARLRRFV